ncbi:MAG: hypothetical protein EXR75_00665 [Myxococcales bacterium]|nr:hypothetical protein [Myxococcales bacterium]
MLTVLGPLAFGLHVACSAGQRARGSSGGSGDSSSGGTDATTTTSGAGTGVSTGSGFEGCAAFTKEAEQSPAAMLIVLDASASMLTSAKWTTSQLAVVSAIDKDVFDSMSLGLLRFPTGTVTGPDCVFGFPVTCGYTALPQVPLAFAGTNKSNAGMGVRSQIYNSLQQGPVSSNDDGSPVYDSLAGGYLSLKALGGVDKRILVLITDGGFSCTSLAGRPAYQDLNGCDDWEIPTSVNTLIKQAASDPNAPVATFIVGVPGTNTNGGKTGPFDNPPYPMLLALSTYAVSGAPELAPADCDKSAVYSQQGSLAAKPCHFDLSSGQLDVNALATSIAKIRGSALGCVYPLPEPPPGESIQFDLVNVEITLEGAISTVPKRSNPSDTCELDGCWDYNSKQEVELFGKTCLDIGKATAAKVDIVVGCETIIK